MVTSHFVFLYRPNGLEWPRLGMAVSRKAGGSVVRSRIKRVIREAFRRLPEPYCRMGMDVVVIPRPSLPKPATLATADRAFSDWTRRLNRDPLPRRENGPEDGSRKETS